MGLVIEMLNRCGFELVVGYWIGVGLNHLWVVESVWAVERVWVWIGLGYWIGIGWLFWCCWDVYGGWGFFESVWVGYFGFGISNSGAVGFGFVWLIVCFGFSGWLVVLDSGFYGLSGCLSLMGFDCDVCCVGLNFQCGLLWFNAGGCVGFGGSGFQDPFLGFMGCGLSVGHEVLVRLWIVFSGCWWFSVGF